MGLRNGDLRDLVNNVCEIDNYKSKMGDDEDIVVLSFSVSDINAAGDLVEFIERGFDFVLDADSTASELDNGSYKVFVEMERNSSVPDQIMEIIDGVGKLSGQPKFKFRYYKNFRSVETTLENLEENIPADPEDYGIKLQDVALESYSNFFNKSFLESVEMNNNILTIKKIHGDPLYFNFIDIGDKDYINASINETISVDDNNFAEIIYLSKYLGDYNITKFGNKITFENKNKVLVLTRINT